MQHILIFTFYNPQQVLMFLYLYIPSIEVVRGYHTVYMSKCLGERHLNNTQDTGGILSDVSSSISFFPPLADEDNGKTGYTCDKMEWEWTPVGKGETVGQHITLKTTWMTFPSPPSFSFSVAGRK